jgi:MoxR-like ATPase
MYENIKTLEASMEVELEKIELLKTEISQWIIGQKEMINHLLITLLSNGHLLLEGLPGLAKTLTINTLAKTLGLNFQRIQFTPDMLPADLTGTNIFDPKTTNFIPKKGPIFSNIILADEINRSPAKVQSALLEAMQERQVTIGENTFLLEAPFLVLATQNPIEQEGTYPLPEAQLDRFLMKSIITYPTKEEEKEILNKLDRLLQEEKKIKPVIKKKDLFAIQKLVADVYVDDKLKDYILNIVWATRKPKEYDLQSLESLIEVGVSPRASIYLVVCSKAIAFLKGRGYVTPQDVKEVAFPILRHRLKPSFEAEAERKNCDDILHSILEKIPVP